MTKKKSRFPALIACLFAGIAVGFLFSPVKKGIRVRVNVYNGTGASKKRVMEAGFGTRAGSGKKE